MSDASALPLPDDMTEPVAEALPHGLGRFDVFASVVFPASIDADDVRRMRQEARMALQARGARWQSALLSADGCRLLGHWRAADAGSVIEALGIAGIEPAEIWNGAVLELTGGVAANVIVEDSRNDSASIRSIFPYDRFGKCLVRRRITPVRVVISLDGRRLLAFYHAPETESVRQCQRDGSVCAGRVWACLDIDG